MHEVEMSKTWEERMQGPTVQGQSLCGTKKGAKGAFTEPCGENRTQGKV